MFGDSSRVNIRRIILAKRKRREHHPKIMNYFEEVIPSYPLSDFKAHFRMSRTTFEKIIQDIGGNLQRRGDLPNALSPEKQLCIAMWTFANQEVYRSIADRFGVSKDTAWNNY
ncbi:uncharacterized protein LOC122499080 [Leptopilina heterotoma]|uniref:uncharacterized protein LOC122499080 n=1 Tax=Leptopilina heterotoma TaxID=63436 RepID=UPI001CA88B66|nr:uncharacterized protein LOC122499080 [Leptopilina heterotoma]